MTQWLAGMRITADRLNDASPVALTSPSAPAPGFTLTAFTARKTSGVVEWSIILVRSGATITAGSSGNINDVICATLPGDCWPGATYYTSYDKAGTATGSVRVSTSGVCTLTTLDPTAALAAGDTVNFSGAFTTG